MRRGAGGFSLLELMTVMTILGILVSVAFPSFQYLSSTTRIKSTSTELYLALIRTRNEAVKRNRLVSLVKNAGGWGNGWQIISDTNNDGAFDASDTVVMNGSAPGRVTITSPQDSVTFLTSGRVQGTASVSFVVTSLQLTTVKRCIAVDLTGKPYIRDPGAGTC